MATVPARVQLLLPLLATLALLSVTASPDHLLVGLAVAGLCALASQGPAARRAGTGVRAALGRAAACRGVGVRPTDPGRPGNARPRAPGLG